MGSALFTKNGSKGFYFALLGCMILFGTFFLRIDVRGQNLSKQHPDSTSGNIGKPSQTFPPPSFTGLLKLQDQIQNGSPSDSEVAIQIFKKYESTEQYSWSLEDRTQDISSFLAFLDSNISDDSYGLRNATLTLIGNYTADDFYYGDNLNLFLSHFMASPDLRARKAIHQSLSRVGYDRDLDLKLRNLVKDTSAPSLTRTLAFELLCEKYDFDSLLIQDLLEAIRDEKDVALKKTAEEFCSRHGRSLPAPSEPVTQKLNLDIRLQTPSTAECHLPNDSWFFSRPENLTAHLEITVPKGTIKSIVGKASSTHPVSITTTQESVSETWHLYYPTQKRVDLDLTFIITASKVGSIKAIFRLYFEEPQSNKIEPLEIALPFLGKTWKHLAMKANDTALKKTSKLYEDPPEYFSTFYHEESINRHSLLFSECFAYLGGGNRISELYIFGSNPAGPIELFHYSGGFGYSGYQIIDMSGKQAVQISDNKNQIIVFDGAKFRSVLEYEASDIGWQSGATFKRWLVHKGYYLFLYQQNILPSQEIQLDPGAFGKDSRVYRALLTWDARQKKYLPGQYTLVPEGQ